MTHTHTGCASDPLHARPHLAISAIVLALLAGLAACGDTQAPSGESGAALTEAVGERPSAPAVQIPTQSPTLNPVAAGTYRIEPGNPKPIAQAASSIGATPVPPSTQALAGALTHSPLDAAARVPQIVVLPGSPTGVGIRPADAQPQR